MSRCGYYTCKGGKPACTNPEKKYSDSFPWVCDMCRRSCGGIWPSQLPHVDMRKDEFDVLDSDGSVIVKFGRKS